MKRQFTFKLHSPKEILFNSNSKGILPETGSTLSIVNDLFATLSNMNYINGIF